MGLAALKIPELCAHPFPTCDPAARVTDNRLFSPTAADCRVSENGGYCGEGRLEGLRGRWVVPGGHWNAAHARGRLLGREEGQRVSKGWSGMAESPQIHSKSHKIAQTNPRMT